MIQKKQRYCPQCRRPVRKVKNVMFGMSQKSYDCGAHFGPFLHALKTPDAKVTLSGVPVEQVKFPD